MRLEQENPRRRIAEKVIKKRLKKREWRNKAREHWGRIMGDKKSGWTFPGVMAPWKQIDMVKFNIEGKKTDDDQENLELAKAKMNDNKEFKWIIYTDGSAAEGREKGGAGIVIKEIVNEEETIEEIVTPAGQFCSSYQTEMIAIERSLEWMLGREEEWHKAKIVTDSKSSLQSIRRFNFKTKNNILASIYNQLEELGKRGKSLDLVWVPSHCGLPGNEEADRAANEAGKREQSGKGWLYEVAKARIKAETKTRTLIHPRCIETYGQGGVIEERDAEIPKEEMRSFRRFRMGHSMELRSYLHRIGKEENPACRLCGEEEEDTTHVTTRCPGALDIRKTERISSMADLCRRPRGAARMWKYFRDKCLEKG